MSVAQYFSGEVVTSLLGLLDLRGGQVFDSRSLENEPPDYAIVALVGGPFPGGVGMSLVDFNPVAIQIGKLTAVIRSNALKHVV